MTTKNGQLRETNNTGHKSKTNKTQHNTGHKSKTNKVKKYNTAQKT